MHWLRRLAKALLVLLAVYGGWSLWPKAEPTVQVYYPTDFSTAPKGVVGFPSWNAATAKALIEGPDDEDRLTGGGQLILPPEASAENPVPAVVILHGSGGDWTGRSIYLANRLADHGIAGFAVDTFVARDLKASDDYFTRLQKASIYSQIIDSFNALQALQNHPAIQPDKIAVTGFSLGAAAALYAMFEPVAEAIVGAEGPRFSAYASFYAGCSFDFEDFRVEGSPVLLMMGEADESMSVERCEWFRDKLVAHNVEANLNVYPDAGHGWEQPYPQAFVPGAAITKDCLMLWTKDNRTIEQSTGHNIDSPIGAMLAFSKCSNRDGYTQGLNIAAKEQSWQDFYRFLRSTWSAVE